MPSIFAVVCDGPAEFETWKLQSWGLVCLAWDIDELWYVDRCKGEKRLGAVQFHEQRLRAKPIDSLEAALDEAKESRRVVLEGPAPPSVEAIDLREYRHPERALYLFGGDRSAGLARTFAKLDADWVLVPARRGVYGFLCGAAVAQHRYAQTHR